MAKHPEAPGQKPGWCIHYRAPSFGDTCAAGVQYASLVDETTGKPPLMARSPCFIKPTERPFERAPCGKLRPPTQDEIQAYRAWQASRVSDLSTALLSIEDWVKQNKGKAARTVIKCPKCGADLYVMKTAGNNHTRGQCSKSATCIGWIQ